MPDLPTCRSPTTTSQTMLPKNRIPTHPGEILLEEFLNPLGVTQTLFADHIGRFLHPLLLRGASDPLDRRTTLLRRACRVGRTRRSHRPRALLALPPSHLVHDNARLDRVRHGVHDGVTLDV